MKTYFVEELEKETGVSKRKIYNLIRRVEFYKRFNIEKMADLPDLTRNERLKNFCRSIKKEIR